MATHKRTWQKAEQRAAALFGCNRARCSGSSGRPDASRSDSTHDTLYLECKLRARCAVRSLHDETAELARREGKTPVLALFAKGRPGFLLAVHSDDLPALVAEYLRANPPTPLPPA